MNNINQKLKRIAVIFSITLFITACSVNHTSYVLSYKDSMSKSHNAIELGSVEFNDAWVAERINSVMKHLKSADIKKRVADLYADELYFNDTMHTFNDSAQLANYLHITGQRVSMIEIDIDDVSVKGKDAYARWTMRYRVANKPLVESIGMTHFRFNEDGKVVLHQDYWDSVEGLYRTVPLVGFLLKKVENATAVH